MTAKPPVLCSGVVKLVTASKMSYFLVVDSQDYTLLRPGSRIEAYLRVWNKALTGKSKTTRMHIDQNGCLNFEGDFELKSRWGQKQWGPV